MGIRAVQARRRGAMLCAVLLVSGLLTAFSSVTSAPPASAADGSQFSDGNIISDAVFFNGASMSAADVQAFLNSKGGVCQTGYTCLRSYTETTTAIPANPMCAAYVPGVAESSASIIAKVGAACGISQKVILATLEKEQGLVTATAPTAGRYAAAMGALCPDTAPCDSTASGFFRQVYTGAYLFKRYTQPPGTGAGTEYSSRFDLMYPVGQTSAINYQVDIDPPCGTKNVFIQNQATHVLYVYTPYTPNPAALGNLYGVGDRCSAYGNRNFWRNFTDWFGSTQFESSEQTGLYAVNANGDLMLYRGTGRGSWATPVQVGNGWSSMRSVVSVGDFNRDGKRDVVALNAQGQMWLYPTDSPTTWGTPVVLDSGWDPSSTLVAAGDFDENGTSDLFVRDPAGDLWLLRGNGTSGYTSKSKVGTGWAGFNQIVGAIDWNGDGHSDVIARSASGDLVAYYGTGAGGWLGSFRIGTGWSGFSWISSVGDFNADGTADLVAASTDGRLTLYAGTGGGGWKSVTPIGTGWTGMSAAFGFGPNPAAVKPMQPGLGDVNSDAARDVLAWGLTQPTPRYAGRAVVSRNTAGELLLTKFANGAWQQPVTIGTGWGSVAQVLGTGDIRRDGSADILSLDSTGTLRAYPTDGSTITGAPTVLATGWATGTLLIDAGDFDGDGLTDLITREPNGDLWLYPGSSSSGLGTRSKIGNGWSIFDTILGAGDWDGDSYPDLLARTPAGGLFLYSGNGKGGWKASKQIGVGWQVLSQLAVIGDWNQDGSPDLIGRNTAGNTLVYQSNGVGGWRTVTDTGAALTSTVASGAGALGQPTMTYSLYFGSGKSSIKGSSTFSTGTTPGQNVVAAGDINGDGQKELVWRDSRGYLMSQSYNSSGLIAAPVQRATDASSVNLLVGVGDFDGDGLGDVLARDSSGALWLYRGSTGTTFQARMQVGSGWSGMSSVLGVGDFNGDGKTDVIAISTAGDMYLYPGAGRSAFGGAILIGNGWSGMDVVFSPGDFSGDGKADLLARQRSTGALFMFAGSGNGTLLGGGTQVGRGWNIFSGIG